MTNKLRCTFQFTLILVIAATLAACGGGDESGSTGNNGSIPGGVDPRSSANSSPALSGTPSTVAVVGQPYRFEPIATDGDGDDLTFAISNMPSWASFDATTGVLSGTPTAGDVGQYSGIRISVGDGIVTTSLTAFDIEVQAVAAGQVTLSWTAPTQNVDGTPLTDLAGYRIHYGRETAALDLTIDVDVGLSSVVIDNLGPGTWYFAMTSRNSRGVESERTAAIEKTI